MFTTETAEREASPQKRSSIEEFFWAENGWARVKKRKKKSDKLNPRYWGPDFHEDPSNINVIIKYCWK